MTELLDQAVRLIRELRNRRDVDTNWPAFRALVAGNSAAVISTFSTRWLISVCDTFADYGDEIERRDALLVSTFLNMLRLAEVTRFVRPTIDAEKLTVARGDLVELYDGVCTFSVDRQDVFLNLAKRTERQLSGTFIGSIWREIVRRLHNHDTVLAEFRALSAKPERYFPLTPLEMADNYGVV